MIIGNLVFFVTLYLTDVHFRGKLQRVGAASEQKLKCQPNRTRETGGFRLLDELYELNE